MPHVRLMCAGFLNPQERGRGLRLSSADMRAACQLLQGDLTGFNRFTLSWALERSQFRQLVKHLPFKYLEQSQFSVTAPAAAAAARVGSHLLLCKMFFFSHHLYQPADSIFLLEPPPPQRGGLLCTPFVFSRHLPCGLATTPAGHDSSPSALYPIDKWPSGVSLDSSRSPCARLFLGRVASRFFSLFFVVKKKKKKVFACGRVATTVGRLP